MKRLHRFWFEFEKQPWLKALNLGCGVTAYDYDDALQLLREKVFVDNDLPKILSCAIDVDVTSLDPGHVLPNVGLVIRRGVWFPLGYDPFP